MAFEDSGSGASVPRTDLLTVKSEEDRLESDAADVLNALRAQVTSPLFDERQGKIIKRTMDSLYPLVNITAQLGNERHTRQLSEDDIVRNSEAALGMDFLIEDKLALLDDQIKKAGIIGGKAATYVPVVRRLSSLRVGIPINGVTLNDLVVNPDAVEPENLLEVMIELGQSVGRKQTEAMAQKHAATYTDYLQFPANSKIAASLSLAGFLVAGILTDDTIRRLPIPRQYAEEAGKKLKQLYTGTKAVQERGLQMMLTGDSDSAKRMRATLLTNIDTLTGYEFMQALGIRRHSDMQGIIRQLDDLPKDDFTTALEARIFSEVEALNPTVVFSTEDALDLVGEGSGPKSTISLEQAANAASKRIKNKVSIDPAALTWGNAPQPEEIIVESGSNRTNGRILSVGYVYADTDIEGEQEVLYCDYLLDKKTFDWSLLTSPTSEKGAPIAAHFSSLTAQVLDLAAQPKATRQTEVAPEPAKKYFAEVTPDRAEKIREQKIRPRVEATNAQLTKDTEFKPSGLRYEVALPDLSDDTARRNFEDTILANVKPQDIPAVLEYFDKINKGEINPSIAALTSVKTNNGEQVFKDKLYTPNGRLRILHTIATGENAKPGVIRLVPGIVRYRNDVSYGKRGRKQLREM